MSNLSDFDADSELLFPDDRHNRALQANVRPQTWENPQPAGRYELAVIGAGTAGLVAAAGAAGLGARVALIERRLMGGDCLNFGCVPSKTLLSSASASAYFSGLNALGVSAAGVPEVDFSAVMERVRRVRAEISPHDSAERFRSLGVDVFFGQAEFLSGDSIGVEGRTLNFKKAVIASGARPALPDIKGLQESGYFTNETIFSITELPPRLGVIGAGPVGSELAQAFLRLGSKVTLISNSKRVLPREEPDASQAVLEAFQREGMQLVLDASIKEVRAEPGSKVISGTAGGKAFRCEVDAILLAAGRMPNVEGLNLERAGVTFDGKQGIHVDDTLRTSNPRVFAAGDVCLKQKFTHAADFTARIVIQNALFFGRKKLSSLTIPWCTYTSPEIARVGLSVGEARQRGIAADVYRKPFREVDRARAEGDTDGFVQILCREGSGKIIGATVVGRNAGDLITGPVFAMTHGIGLSKLASVIHPYPTRSEALRQLGDLYNRSRLTPFTRKLLQLIIRLGR